MNTKSTLRLINKAIELVKAFEVVTSYDEKRKNEALRLCAINIERVKNNEPIDSGLYGKVKELISHNPYSPLTRVRAQGKDDSYINIDDKRIALEVKTGGGRIESLYAMSERKRATTYIRYTLDWDTPVGKPKKDGTCKPSEHRFFDGVMLVSVFLEIVESTKAITIAKHSGQNDAERAIQKESKKLYEALLNCEKAVPYVRGGYYVKEDFE